MDLPAGWHEGSTVLSADGSRFAGHYHRAVETKKLIEHGIVVWDTRGHKVLGVLALPGEPMNPAPKIPELGDTTAGIRIALSGDGARLAASDGQGAIHVYDVSKISGMGKPRLAANAAAAPIDAKAVRADYEKEVARARQHLLDQFDEVINGLEKNPGKLKKDFVEAALARLKEQKVRFDKNGLVPWSQEIVGSTPRYLSALSIARTKVLETYGNVEMPADLRELIDKPQVIACWKHQPGDVKITLYANGKINDPAGAATWTLEEGQDNFLILRWKDAKAPGGFQVANCCPSEDGQSFFGKKQNNAKITGTLVKDE
jgi:hypothetical protein